MTMHYSGVLDNATNGQAVTRVVAVAGDRVLAATAVDVDGRWSLNVDSGVNWIVAQQRERAVAAIASVPEKAARLALPALVNVELEQHDIPPGVALWIDPVELPGFPQHLMWSLFVDPGGIVKMHVIELGLEAGAHPAAVRLQPGRYRFSGGRISLRPGPASETIVLAGITNIATGRRIDATNGLVVAEVDGPARYRLHFTTATTTGADRSVSLDRH